MEHVLLQRLYSLLRHFLSHARRLNTHFRHSLQLVDLSNMRVGSAHRAKLSGAQRRPAAFCIGAVGITTSAGRKDGSFADFNVALRDVEDELEDRGHDVTLEWRDRRPNEPKRTHETASDGCGVSVE